MFERNFIGQLEGAPRRHDDELSITAIAGFSHHRRGRAELLVVLSAPGAGATRRQVVQTNAVADAEFLYLATDRFNHAGGFVPERHWQWMNPRFPGAIMRVGMTDP